MGKLPGDAGVPRRLDGVLARAGVSPVPGSQWELTSGRRVLRATTPTPGMDALAVNLRGASRKGISTSPWAHCLARVSERNIRKATRLPS